MSIFPPMGLELFQQNLLKRFSFLPLNCLTTLVGNQLLTVYKHVGLFLESVLFKVEVSNEMFEIENRNYFIFLFCFADYQPYIFALHMEKSISLQESLPTTV